MSSPGFNLPFDLAYDVYSMWRADFAIPSFCWAYKPDNNADYACDVVIAPAPELGSKIWTRNGRRILIGVYRDEGRPSDLIRSARIVSWSRVGNVITAIDPQPTRLSLGDAVTVYNMTASPSITATVTEVVDEYTFKFTTTAIGGTSGLTGGYAPVAPVNFYEQFIVFRYLPSYKLVPWQEVMDLLTAATPIVGTAPVDLTDIVTGNTIKTTRTVFNGSRLTSSGSRSGTELWRQQFDENSKPLTWTYDKLGRPDLPKTVSTPNRNNPVLYSPPVLNEVGSADPLTNEKLYVRDYYGFELNDTTRGPFYADDIITYDPNTENGLKRKLNGSEVIYEGVLHDDFGNFVEAAAPDNTVVVRRPILPITVDQFNLPYKQPRPRSTV